MKRLRLKKWVKVVLTIVTLMISVIAYLKSAEYGILAQTQSTYELLCIGIWFWLLAGQMIILSLVWES